MRRLVAATLAVAVALVPSCGGDDGDDAEEAAPIVLGEVDPLTGPLAAEGFHNGILLAVEEVNEAGGIGGRRIELVVRDNQSRPDVASSAAQALVRREGAVALTGGFVDSLVAPVAAVASSEGVPFVAAASLAEELTASGNSYFFRVASLGAFTTSTVEFVRSLQVQTVGIVHASTPGSTQLASNQRAELERAGLTVAPFESVTIGAQDFAPLLAHVRNASPDVLLVDNPAEGDTILLANQMRALDVRPPVVLFSFGLEPATLVTLGDVADGLHATVAWEPGLDVGGEAGTSLDEAHRERFGEPADEAVAHGYSAAAALIEAMRTLPSDQITSERLAEALREVSVETALGTVRFDPNGDPEAYQRYVVQVQDGAYSIVFRPNS